MWITLFSVSFLISAVMGVTAILINYAEGNKFPLL